MEDLYTFLFNYFDKEMAEGKIDFRLRAARTDDGIKFYIHPLDKDGQTIDLKLTKVQSTYITLHKH